MKDSPMLNAYTTVAELRQYINDENESAVNNPFRHSPIKPKWEAFRQLWRVMQEVRDKKLKFNINTWADHQDKNDVYAYHDPNHVIRDLKKSLKTGEHVCGTAACALGWAMVDPWFYRRGMKLVDGLNPPDESANFFGINEELESWFFMPSHYVNATPHKVQRKIEILFKAEGVELHPKAARKTKRKK